MEAISAELLAFLQHCEDCTYPRQAADVSSISDLILLATRLQVCAEESPAYLSTQLGSAPWRARLLSRLAFWLCAWPGADNVVACIAILLYLVALTPGGCAAIAETLVPPESHADAQHVAAAACASAAGSLDALPRSRLLLPRLLYSVLRTSGRVSPANGMLSCGRAATLCRLMAGELQRCAVPGSPPLALLRLRALLLHPTTLAVLARTVALYAARPGPRDPLTVLRASSEAMGALVEIAAAGSACDEACGEPCASPLAVARACADALAGAGGACLTPTAATALLETLRNSLVTLPRSLDALFKCLGMFGAGGDSELGGPEAFFLVGGWGGPLRCSASNASASASASSDGATYALGSLEDAQDSEQPLSRAPHAALTQRALHQCARALQALHACPWVTPLVAQQPPFHAPAHLATAQPACASLAEHYLSALFNLFASSALRCALAVGAEFGEQGGVTLGQVLLRTHHVACAALARWGYLSAAAAAGEGEGGGQQQQQQLQRPPFTLRAVEAALRVLDCPLAGNGLLCGSSQAAHFFSSGGGELVASLLQNWAGQPGSCGLVEPCCLRVAGIVAAHLEFPEAVLGPQGCVAGMLRSLAGWLRSSLAARPCRDMQDARYVAVSTLASRAANVPRDAWGGAAGAGDGAGEWGACAAELMGLLDDAVDAAALPPQAPVGAVQQYTATA